MTPAQGHTRKADQDKLKRLAAFGPIFRDPRIIFGKWHRVTGRGTPQKPFTFPWFERSKVATQFCQVLNESGWILRNFDWAKWGHAPEGQNLFGSRKAIASADCKQLAKLLTALVRQDRFVEGALAGAYRDKTLLAVVERAEALIGAKAPSFGKRKKAFQVYTLRDGPQPRERECAQHRGSGEAAGARLRRV